MSFPVENLTQNFDCLRTALMRGPQGPVFSEGVREHIDLASVSLRSFAIIYLYLIEYKKGQARTAYRMARQEPIDELLQASIAADYLGIRDHEGFEACIAECLALILLENRLKLKAQHVELVCDHAAFESPEDIYKVTVCAGVRPFLHRHMLNIDFTPRKHDIYPYPRPGHENPDTWKRILEHYPCLRRCHEDYDDALATQASETLQTAWEKTRNGYRVAYTDPLTLFVSFKLPEPNNHVSCIRHLKALYARGAGSNLRSRDPPRQTLSPGGQDSASSRSIHY